MFSFRELKHCPSLYEHIICAAFPHVSNVFNPSIIVSGNLIYLVFRGIDNVASRIDSYFIVFDGAQNKITEAVNLSHAWASYGIQRVADPKLFSLGKELCLTFNTGYSSHKNDIYIVKDPSSSSIPRKVVYSRRQTIEKNWAFFKWSSDVLALYKLNPLIILRLKKTSQSCYEFEDFFHGEKISNYRGYSIGSQVVFRDGVFYFIAHRKIYLLRKRMYWGVLTKLIPECGTFHLASSRYRMVHSFHSMLGARKKYNKNLISCTYFSGLDFTQKGEMILSYGINDVDFRIKKVYKDLVWN